LHIQELEQLYFDLEQFRDHKQNENRKIENVERKSVKKQNY